MSLVAISLIDKRLNIFINIRIIFENGFSTLWLAL